MVGEDIRAEENVAREENLVGQMPNLIPKCNMVGEDIMAEENIARKAHLVGYTPNLIAKVHFIF